MPKKDDPLDNEIFPDVIQRLTLDQQGYEENKKEKNVLSKWKNSYEAGFCPFSQERGFSPAEKVSMESSDLIMID